MENKRKVGRPKILEGAVSKLIWLPDGLASVAQELANTHTCGNFNELIRWLIKKEVLNASKDVN